MFQKTNKIELFSIGEDDEDIKQVITQQKYKMICLNDVIIDIGFESEKKRKSALGLMKYFQTIQCLKNNLLFWLGDLLW